ncbi:molybdopterin synthase [Halobaculum gomorrense]|uniref:Molybdopterin synthase subunit MoaE /molybdopterin guanine dinucleotide biosynthesis accessory protein MobB n=1 Tax=Halobaculum gomorrense TaxID=43928 RepID=A0A1M5LXX6_9EURY|nr:molybdopterin synthase [Halobaculum gomorrense]SHG69917.1 molybdopterin synthase subunit MoaE /molybdopterin guanine dinucleotide biosynthesis accessory protein MobB [Halobaculum gomorrense]
MRTLSLVGPGTADLLDPLAARLDGRVATVRRDDGIPTGTETGEDAADTDYRLGDDGAWTAAGTDDSFDDVLDRLAPDYDYALVTGFSRLRLPTVVVGDEAVPGDEIRRAADASDLSLDDLVDAVETAEPHVTLEALVDEAKASEYADRSGAIATFTGRVRAKDDADDERTEVLEFEKYEGVAADRMARIERELEAREGVFDVRMHHRVGVVADGEDIVFVVVLAGHRTEAFRTVEDGINRLKDEVPIFKKETTEADEFWVHERSQ